MALPSGTRIDGFQVIREIGRGGMSVVYLAEELRTGRKVALKLLPLGDAGDERSRERFLREMRATAMLEHPNVIRVYTTGEWGGQPYYVMEYIDGASVEQFMSFAAGRQKESQLTEGQRESIENVNEAPTRIVQPEDKEAAEGEEEEEEEEAGKEKDRRKLRATGKRYFQTVARIIRDAAYGVDYAHRRGIVHRDIKPSNLLLTRSGEVRVADFGVALHEGEIRLTQPGGMVGTLQYMSPEQLLAKSIRIDARTDVYSLGATLYELLTLRPPFEGRTREQLVTAISFDDPKDPRKRNPQIPRALATVALKAMEKDPKRRYPSARAMAEDLDRFLNGEPIWAAPPSLWERCVKLVKRHKVISTAVAAGLLAAAVAGTLVWRSMERRRAARVKEFVHRAEDAERRGRPDLALDCYRSALALDQGNILLAAAVDRIEADVRARQAAERLRERRRKAQELTNRARPLVERYPKLCEKSDKLKEDIEQIRRDINRIRPIRSKGSLEDLERQRIESEDALRAALRDEAYTLSLAEELLHGALALDAEYPAARAELAKLYYFALLTAERRGMEDEARRRRQLASLYDDGALAEPLKGDGVLMVDTEPQGARVMLFQYCEQGRVLDAQRVRALGATPLTIDPMPMGDYLLVIEKSGFRPVKCPVLLRRQGRVELRIPLYTDAQIGRNLVYVPPGPCIVGGDPKAEWPLPKATVFVKGFFIGRTEVTCGEYLKFLNWLAKEDAEEAARRAPRRGNGRSRRIPWWKQRIAGGYALPEELGPDYPVCGVSYEDALAYCRWLSQRTGRRFRLPTVVEWEKAARGADGRFFPWGNYYGLGFANLRPSWRRVRDEWLVACRSFEMDQSPFGVFDMVGNVGEMCSDIFCEDPKARTVKGYWFRGIPRKARLASRRPFAESTRRTIVGFRVVCEPPKANAPLQ